MKKIFIAFAAILAICVLPMTAAAQGFSSNAKAAILIDAGSNNVLYELNPDEQYECAGVTKIMSVLLFCEQEKAGMLSLSDTVTISAHAASVRGSTVFLDANTNHSVSDLLKAVQVCSANDACVALAEKVAGSEQAFVEMMNKKAQVLGIGASFENATGVENSNKMSAKDASVICCELLKYELAFKFCDIWMQDYTHPDGRQTEMVNQNRLVRFYQGCDGFATGSSASSGYCLAATAKRDNSRFIYISLGMPSSSARFDEAKRAFDYAFAGFVSKTMVRKGQQIAANLKVAGGTEPTINIYAAQEFSILIEKGKEGTLEKELVLLEDICAPIAEGEVVGYLKILADGDEIGRVDVVSGKKIDVLNFLNAFKRIMVWWLFT